MAKFTDQNIPPELQSAYSRLISPGKAGVSSQGTARIRAAAVTPAAPRINSELAIIDRAIASLAAVWGYSDSSPNACEWRNQRKLELQRNVHDSKFWNWLPPLTVKYCGVEATWAPDPNPPPWEFRDPNNLPTIPQYGEGVEVSEETGYFGMTENGYFSDRRLIWQEVVYALPSPVTSQHEADFFHLWDVFHPAWKVTTRPTRNLLSVLSKARFFESSDAALLQHPAPVEGAHSAYWRYELPEGMGNEGGGTMDIYFWQRMPEVEPGKVCDRLKVCICPRPCFGREFNNNTQIYSYIEDNHKIFFPRAPT